MAAGAAGGLLSDGIKQVGNSAITGQDFQYDSFSGLVSTVTGAAGAALGAMFQTMGSATGFAASETVLGAASSGVDGARGVGAALGLCPKPKPKKCWCD
jgi:hypothetical protein